MNLINDQYEISNSEAPSMATNKQHATAGSSLSKDSALASADITLCRDQAARWLEYLTKWHHYLGPESSLGQLIQQLQDACWLARWKRENVILELRPVTVIESIEVLVQLCAVNDDPCDSEIGDELIRVLSQGTRA